MIGLWWRVFLHVFWKRNKKKEVCFYESKWRVVFFARFLKISLEDEHEYEQALTYIGTMTFTDVCWTLTHFFQARFEDGKINHTFFTPGCQQHAVVRQRVGEPAARSDNEVSYHPVLWLYSHDGRRFVFYFFIFAIFEEFFCWLPFLLPFFFMCGTAEPGLLPKTQPEEFIHIFVNQMDWLLTFLERMVQTRPQLHSQVYDTLLELYLRPENTAGGTEAAWKIWQKKVTIWAVVLNINVDFFTRRCPHTRKPSYGLVAQHTGV